MTGTTASSRKSGEPGCPAVLAQLALVLVDEVAPARLEREVVVEPGNARGKCTRCGTPGAAEGAVAARSGPHPATGGPGRRPGRGPRGSRAAIGGRARSSGAAGRAAGQARRHPSGTCSGPPWQLPRFVRPRLVEGGADAPPCYVRVHR